MKQISAPSHSLSAAGQDTGDSAAPDTVTDTVKQAENSDNTAEHTVTDTVKTPISIARLFDADPRIKRKKEDGGHRTDVFLNPDERKMLEFIRDKENTTGQSVLRVALIHLYRTSYRNGSDDTVPDTVKPEQKP
jgi:hypothetical protein